MKGLKQLKALAVVFAILLLFVGCSAFKYIPTYIPRLVIENPYDYPLTFSFWIYDLDPPDYSRKIPPHSRFAIDFPSGFSNSFTVKIKGVLFSEHHSEIVFLTPTSSTACVLLPEPDYGYLEIVNKTGDSLYDIGFGQDGAYPLSQCELVKGNLEEGLILDYRYTLSSDVPSSTVLFKYYIRVSTKIEDYLTASDRIVRSNRIRLSSEPICIEPGDLLRITLYKSKTL